MDAEKHRTCTKIAQTVEPLRSTGFEMLCALMLMNWHDPLKVSWQPVAQLLNRFDAGRAMLGDGFLTELRAYKDSVPPELSSARASALTEADGAWSDLLLLVKKSQMERLAAEPFDDLAVRFRNQTRPKMSVFLDALADFAAAA